MNVLSWLVVLGFVGIWAFATWLMASGANQMKRDRAARQFAQAEYEARRAHYLATLTPDEQDEYLLHEHNAQAQRDALTGAGRMVGGMIVWHGMTKD